MKLTEALLICPACFDVSYYLHWEIDENEDLVCPECGSCSEDNTIEVYSSDPRHP